MTLSKMLTVSCTVFGSHYVIIKITVIIDTNNTSSIWPLEQQNAVVVYITTPRYSFTEVICMYVYVCVSRLPMNSYVYVL